MPKILLVRLSSMGDVIHNLPAVSDLIEHYPNAEIDWVVEEGFVELPALHPAIHRIIPFALRRWRRQRFDAASRAEMRNLRATLRTARYDLVIDSQCLVKSALVARLSKAPICGMDWRSAREPLASRFYDRRIDVPWSLNAVLRYRRLHAQALGYAADGPINYGIQAAALSLPWCAPSPYAVLLTATSRDDKLWPEADWIALGKRLQADGLGLVLPWGNPVEEARAQRIAAGLPGAVVAPRLSLSEAARLLADARLAIGVDTGLAHLAAALSVPVVALYTSTDPAATGVIAERNAVNLGGIGQRPEPQAVHAAAQALLA
ncbi:lipopolysaccharide heptosyltransferase I [Chitinimonas sp.]|uniref:lipopolysaccharide heptosyltransferase I n=1 Tax=Chitinimonas sp. TaxID=1934313 RepID=UPI0035B35C87